MNEIFPPAPSQVAILRHTPFVQSEQFIVTQLRALGSDAVFLSRDSVPSKARGENIDLIVAAGGFVQKCLYTLFPTRFLMRALRGRHIVAIHAHFGVEGEASIRAARKLKVPHVTTLHGFDVSRTTSSLLATFKPAWWRYAIRRKKFLGNRYTKFVAVSSHVRSLAVKLGASPGRVVVIPNGVDLQSFAATSVQPERRVLHVARLVEKKGTSDLIEALASVRRVIPDVRLIIIGDGPLIQSLRALAEELHVSDIVSFKGFRSHDEVRNEMERAAVVCVPSVTAADGDQEGLPQVILEALSIGRAVVATTHSGIPDAIDHGLNGLLSAERDTVALAENLVTVLSDLRVAQHMGAAARDIAMQHFDVRASVQKLRELYDDRDGQ